MSSPTALDNSGANLRRFNVVVRRLWYGEQNAVASAIDYARFRSRSHRAVVRIYDEAGNVIETHEYNGEFKEW